MRCVRPFRLVLLLVAVASASIGPASARGADATSWGGLSFSGSDRDLQAAADTLALAADPSGRGVDVLGHAGERGVFVYRFDTAGNQAGRFAAPGAGAIAVDGAGNIFTGAKSGAVAEYDANGTPIGGFPTGAPVDAMAADGGGGVYVGAGSSVQRFSAAGVLLGSFALRGPLGSTSGIAVDSAGNLFAADPANRRIDEFNSSGSLVRVYGGPDASAGALGKPTAVAVDAAGQVYVVDAGPKSFDVKLYMPDGRYRGVIDAGFFDPSSSPFLPILLAVAPAGDVYFTPYNPDIALIPAAFVPAPRFRVKNLIVRDNDLGTIPISVGRTYALTATVHPSLSSGLQAMLELPPGAELQDGSSAVQPADIPPPSTTRDLNWSVKATKPGPLLTTITLSGTGSDGKPTSTVKRLPLFGLDGPRINVPSALYLPRSHQLLVAVRLGFGGMPIPGPGRSDLSDVLDSVVFPELTVSGGRRRYRSLDFQVGGVADGACQGFKVPRGAGGRSVRVTASFKGSDTLNPASMRRTLRPSTRARGALLKSCLATLGFAGGQTR